MSNTKPAVREPRRDRDGLIRCRVCGCTEADACDPPCGWTPGEDDLCTSCCATVIVILTWIESARRANHTALWREVRNHELARLHASS